MLAESAGQGRAKISVRQLGARPWPRTYIQQLDVSKYTQIVERLVLETEVVTSLLH